METLPGEMIEHIMCSENLSITDVVNFSLTNKYNNLLVTNSNIIWKNMCFKTCPQFVKLSRNKFNYDWYAEVRYIYDLKRRTREILSMMSSRFYSGNVLSNSDFTEWFELYQEKPQTYYYLINDLMNIVDSDAFPIIKSTEVVPITTPGNKTLQYYAMKVLRYLRHLHLTKEWKAFIALPQKLQTLEKGIDFVEQWFQPNINVSRMKKNFASELDALIEKVKKNLKMENPKHPFFVVPQEELETWTNENIECDKYDFLHSEQVRRAMVNLLRWELDELGSFQDTFSTVTSIIGCAVNDIYLIIYESVGRRFGVKYEPIIGPNGFKLRSSEGLTYRYIDFRYCYYGEGEPILSVTNYPVATTQQVFEGIAKKVQIASSPFPSRIIVEKMCWRLEFLELVSPFDVSIKDDLSRLYMNSNMDTTSYIKALIEQKNQAPEQIEPIINILQEYETSKIEDGSLFRTVKPKDRPKNLKYAVGMVMTCRSATFSADLCVICDWDLVGTTLEKQPLYKVLLPNGSYLYVKQYELRLPYIRSSSDFLTWCFQDIGWHFSHRLGAVFVPNAEKEREYPADAAVRNVYNEQFTRMV